MLGQPTVAALNHLLAQSGWALPRLAKYSGKSARFDLMPFSLCCTIQSDGTLNAAPQQASADAICTIAPTLLPRLALGDEAALKLIACSGDAALVEEIMFLARNLRWDAAEDLSGLVGDIAAERMVQLAQEARQRARAAVFNISQAAAEYWTEEQPLVATSRQIASFADGVASLQRAMDALEQRFASLTKAG